MILKIENLHQFKNFLRITYYQFDLAKIQGFQ